MGNCASDQDSYVPFDPSSSVFTPLFQNNNVRDLAAGVSARLAKLYDDLSNLYPEISLDVLGELEEDEGGDQLDKKVTEVFKELTYKEIPSDGPICNAKLSGRGR